MRGELRGAIESVENIEMQKKLNFLLSRSGFLLL